MCGPDSLILREMDSRIWAAWQSQIAAAKQAPGLLPRLMEQPHVELPRFAAAYRQLRRLPRRVRRHLQRHWRQSLAGLALGLALSPGIGFADTITVNGTTCTLINALTTANTDINTGGCVQLPSATAGADTLVLQPSSVHTLTAVDNSTFGNTGLPVISSAITLEGQGSTIRRDSGAPKFRILAVNSTGNLTLKATTIRGGAAFYSSEFHSSEGSGIFNYAGTVTVTNSTITDNASDFGNGSVVNHASPRASAVLTLTHSTVSGNASVGVSNYAFLSGASAVLTLTHSTVSGNGGVGVSNFAGGDYGSGASAVLTLTNSTVSDNGGMGVSNFASSGASAVLTLTHSTVSGNGSVGVSNRAGGDYSSGASAVLTLTNSTVSGNLAGVVNDAHGDYSSGASAVLTLTNSTVSGNRARGVVNYAGGEYGSWTSTVTLTNSTVSGNGGGVVNYAYGEYGSGTSTVTLTNSTVSGNTAGLSGGGIYNAANGGYQGSGVSTVTLTNSTVSGNTANESGGGVYNRAGRNGTSAVTLTRSLLSGNVAPTGAEVFNDSGTITANNYNLLGHSGLTNAQAFSGFTPGATDITATADGTTPTALGAILHTTLAHNGGRTKTLNLVPGSPAIDASPVDADCLPTDQRGIPRPLGAACDIGAVEFIPSPLPLATSCGTQTPTLGCKVNGVPNQPCIGTPGDDVIIGTPGNDVIFGLGGNDIIKGGEGDDCIDGGPGNDTLEGQDGNDRLFGRSGADQVRGGTGDDLLVTGGGKDTVKGDEGNDLLYDTGGQNTLKGGEGDDVIVGPKNQGTIDGDSGTDVCVGGTTQKNCP